MTDKDTVVAVYATHGQAEATIRTLERAGFDMKNLSIVGKGYALEEYPIGFYTAGDRLKTWGIGGALWGGLWGLLFGAAIFALPGIGILAAAGPVVHLLVAAGEGAAIVGGASLLGAALTNLGMSADSVVMYEREIKADKYLVIAHGDAAALAHAREIMRSTDFSMIDAVAA